MKFVKIADMKWISNAGAAFKSVGFLVNKKFN